MGPAPPLDPGLLEAIKGHCFSGGGDGFGARFLAMTARFTTL